MATIKAKALIRLNEQNREALEMLNIDLTDLPTEATHVAFLENGDNMYYTEEEIPPAFFASRLMLPTFKMFSYYSGIEMEKD